MNDTSPSPGVAEDLSAEQTARIRRDATLELARRGVLGAVSYVIVIPALGLLTPLGGDYSWIFGSALAVATFAGAVRLLLLFRFDQFYGRSPRQWKVLYGTAVCLAAAAWGGLTGVTVVVYGISGTSMLFLVTTAGWCAGALSSMTMQIVVLRTYLALMLLPSVAASLTLPASEAQPLVVGLLTFLGYMLIQGRHMNRDYWEALVNASRLDAHTRQRLHDLTYRDSLTGLPNRALFNDRLSQCVLDGRRTSRLVGVMTVNLDRFMNINDTLGHEAGDLLLQTVAARMQGSLRESDTFSRLGADNFALVLPNLSEARDLVKIAQKLMAVLSEPMSLRGLELFMTGSIGIAVFPRDGQAPDHLLKNAEAAMARVKAQGGNGYQFYETDMNAQAMERLTLETRLRRALERNEFVLHYQPKVALATASICGVEALLRWQPKPGELIPPAQFIPLLEDTGLIVPVGEWIIRTACADARRWRESGIRLTPVAVNLSVRQFRDPGLADLIEKTVRDAQLEPGHIEFEITESLLMDDSAYIRDTLARLHTMGLGLSIDDFGTGYSSLGYLKHLPVRTLKIDRSFVKDATTVESDAALVRAIIALAHSLGLRVVAEGVETAAQAQFLASHGCDEMQGFYFSRPLPLETITPLLAQETPVRAEFEALRQAADALSLLAARHQSA